MNNLENVRKCMRIKRTPLASTRFVMQMIEEFRNYINKSRTSAAA
jgi:hypothetical protein